MEMQSMQNVIYRSNSKKVGWKRLRKSLNPYTGSAIITCKQ